MRKVSFCSNIWLALLMMVIVVSCNRSNRNNPGYNYFDDMSKSVAYEYYSANPNFKDSITAQVRVDGTIPCGHIPYTYPKTDEGQIAAGVELVNPIDYTPENIALGKDKYTNYCEMCHGVNGDGKGFLVMRKKFNKEVTSLVSDLTQNKPDGEIFHVITVGSVSGFMGSHSWQLDSDDRWRIVCYIKKGLKK